MLRKSAPYAPYLLVILGLIVAIILVVMFNDNDKKKPATNKAKETSKTQTAGSAARASEPTYKVRNAPEGPRVATNNTVAKKVSSATPAKTATASAASTKASGELVNSGPGETAALVAATVFAAYGGHSFYLRKKLTV